jgi:hypothetical protein
MATQPAIADYPVRFEVQYPEGQNRFMILIRWLLVFPHLIVLMFLSLAAAVVGWIAWWAILFTGRYPEGMFNFVVGVNRWSNNASAYQLFHNAYPPFSMEEGQYPPMLYTVERQERYSRLLIFVKWLLIIPHVVVLYLLYIVGSLVYFVMLFAVLITGRYPRGMFDFVVGVGRWAARVNAYVGLLTDKYPPFAMR